MSAACGAIDKEWFTDGPGRFSVIVDLELTARLRRYVELFGLRLDPFKYQETLLGLEAGCGEVCASIYALFVDAYARTRTYWYMELEDLKRALAERGVPTEWVSIGLRSGVLEVVEYNGKKWVGLKKDLAPW